MLAVRAVGNGSDEGGCLAREYIYVTEESGDHLRTSRRKRVLRVGTSQKTPNDATREPLGLTQRRPLFVQLEFPQEIPLL